MRPLFIIVLLPLIRSARQDFTETSSHTPKQQNNLDYRQLLIPQSPTETTTKPPQVPVQAPTTSTSYNYWWPYPPVGATPTTTTSPMSDTPAAATTTDSASISQNMPPSTRMGSSAGSYPAHFFDFTASDNQTMVTISASTSNTSSARTYPKVQVAKKNTVMYLIPVFAILGLVFGGLVAWIGWGCLTRKPRLNDGERGGRLRRKPRVSELEAGPKYSPCPDDDVFTSEKPPMYHRAEQSFIGHEEVTSLNRADDGFSWAAMDARPVEHDKRPVMPAQPRGRSTSRSRSIRPTCNPRPQDLARSSTGKTQYTETSVSVYSQGDHEGNEDDVFLDDEYDIGTQGARCDPPQRSVGRRIVSRRRRAHLRANSDLRIDDMDMIRETSSKSTRTAITPGFKIVEESPLPTPTDFSHNTSNTIRSFWTLRGLTKDQNRRHEDPYTAIPVRASRRRSESPVKGKYSGRDRVGSVTSDHPLPQSPPQSYNNFNNLCFSPVVGSSGNDRM